MSFSTPGAIRRDCSNAIAITGAVTGEKLSAPGPLRVLRVGAEITVATSGTNAVVTVNSVDGATATPLGTMTVPSLAAGAGCYRDFDAGAAIVPAGSVLSINLTTAATAGSAYLWVEYQELPMSSIDRAALTKVAT